METQRFDRITSSLAASRTRRGFLTSLAAAALGASGLAGLGADDTAAKRKRKKRKGGSGTGAGSRNGGANQIGGGGGRRDRCGGPVGICNADPTPCGRTAEGGVCGCERAVEGNNVCVNSGADNVCDTAVECTSTDGEEATSCRNLVGFHFYCQEAKSANGRFCGCGFGTTTGRVCVPACDNPSPY
jgi:hypothetical protein